MCPGMRPATGWMAKNVSTPRALQRVGQLARRVLGLGHGQAVAGDDDDLAGVGQQHAHVLGRPGPHRAAGVALLAAGGGDDRAERAEEDVGQRAAHGRCSSAGSG